MPELDAPAFRIAAWAGVTLIVGAIVGTLVQAKWQASGVLAAFAIAATGFLIARQRLPALFDLLFVLAALLNAAGWVFEMWKKVPWTDRLTHAYTTFAVTLAFGFLVYDSVRVHFRSRSALFVVTVAALGLALGGCWEILEWVAGVPQSRRELVMDLIMDTLGALLAGVASAWAIRHEPNRRETL